MLYLFHMCQFTKTLTYYPFVFALLISIQLHAQPGIPALGEADPQELRLKTWPADSSVSAIFLLNTQYTEIREGMRGMYSSSTTRRYRLKIFKQEGYKYANVKFPIYSGKYRKISDIRGFVYNLEPNGEISVKRIGRQDIFKDKVSANVTSIAFAFPNLRPGSVIEYTYTIEDEYSTGIPPWIFQYPIPTAMAYCEIQVPSNKEISHKIIARDSVNFNGDITGGGFSTRRNRNTYTVKNIPALKPEPMMGPVTNKLQRIEFSLNLYPGLDMPGTPGWSRINEYVHFASNRISEQVLPNTTTLISDARKISTLSGKVEFIIRELQKNLQWNGDYSFFSNDILHAWVEKTGNNAELNLILMNLLSRTGISCAPLLVSTRSHGKIDKNFVRANQFNGLVVLVPDSAGAFVLDVTAKNLSYDVVPYNIINTEAFLVNDQEGQWVTIVDYRPLIMQTFTASATLDADGVMNGNATVEYFHYSKNAKLQEKDEEDELEESDRPEATSYNTDIIVEDVKIDSTKGNLFPLVETFKFKMQLQGNENIYLLAPIFLDNLKTNPFISDKRNFDIDFGANQEFSVTLNLTVPDNFLVDEIPKDITLIKADSTIRFTRKSSLQAHNLQIHLKLEYFESYFAKEEYTSLKEFFSKMYAILNEPVVLKKK